MINLQKHCGVCFQECGDTDGILHTAYICSVCNTALRYHVRCGQFAEWGVTDIHRPKCFNGCVVNFKSAAWYYFHD